MKKIESQEGKGFYPAFFAAAVQSWKRGRQKNVDATIILYHCDSVCDTFLSETVQ